jgi:putative transposase
LTPLPSSCSTVPARVPFADACPGKPTDNAFIESFNGKFWAERLNAHWFMTLDDVRRKCEAWRKDYNEERPHRAIGNKVPIELVDRSAGMRPTLTEAHRALQYLPQSRQVTMVYVV